MHFHASSLHRSMKIFLCARQCCKLFSQTIFRNTIARSFYSCFFIFLEIIGGHTKQVCFSNQATKSIQKLSLVTCVDLLTLENPVNVNNSFLFVMFIRTFYCYGELGVLHLIDWRFVSGLFVKKHDSTQTNTL